MQDTGELCGRRIWVNVVYLLWPDLPLRPGQLNNDSGLSSVSICLDKRHKGHPRTCAGWTEFLFSHIKGCGYVKPATKGSLTPLASPGFPTLCWVTLARMTLRS